MKILITVFFTILLLKIVLKELFNFNDLKIAFKKYIQALKKLNSLKKNLNSSEIILNNVSKSGLNLLWILIILFLPFIICFSILLIIDNNIINASIISMTPYALILKLKK